MNFIKIFDLHHHSFKRSANHYPKLKKLLSVLLFVLSIAMYATGNEEEPQFDILSQQARLVKSEKQNLPQSKLGKNYYEQAYGLKLTP